MTTPHQEMFYDQDKFYTNNSVISCIYYIYHQSSYLKKKFIYKNYIDFIIAITASQITNR